MPQPGDLPGGERRTVAPLHGSDGFELDSAAVTRTTDAAPTHPVLMEQLKLLHELMKETSDTANQFAGRFIFGGLVAVLALLNVDLVLLGPASAAAARRLPVLAAIVLAVMALSYYYFDAVTKHYAGFRESHRKLKYKLELTLHAILADAEPSEYARYLERSVADPATETREPTYPAGPTPPTFAAVADYLLEHHRHRWRAMTRGANAHLRIAMLLVALTLVVRLLGLGLTAPAP